MSSRTAAVVGLNLGVLLASHLAFRAWIADRFGYLDLDMVGGTSIAWVPLVVAATIAVAMSGRFVVMRLLAWPLIGIVAVFVVDHAVGALRDGRLARRGGDRRVHDPSGRGAPGVARCHAFVVIRAGEGDLHGAPPLELPPCRGRPFVQEGV